MKIRSIYSLICLCFILISTGNAFAQDEQLKEAESAYSQGNYGRAIELYRDMLKTFGESAEVYYNLANAYYKTNDIAPAILYYERALLIDPGDTDIRFNLEMARQRTVDRIMPVGEFFLIKWFDSIQNMGAADSWAKVGIATFLLFIGCLFMYFFSRRRTVRKLGFYFGMLLLAIIVVSNIFAINQKNELINKAKAIVFSPTVTVKSSPNQSGTDLFVIHEGTKVAIRNTLGEWKEIELEDGNVGWMPAKDIELI